MRFLVRLADLFLTPWIFYPLVSLCVLILLRRLHNLLMIRKWEAGRCPDLCDFGIAEPGKEKDTVRVYRVVMLPRWLFFWFHNVKRIRDTGKGDNLAWGWLSWSRFFLMRWRYREGAMSINYRASKMPFSIIRDLVREIEEGVFLGRFMIKIRRWLVFVFWFLLIEVEEEA